MSAITQITVNKIDEYKSRRNAIIASMPAFGSPNSHKARHNAQRDARRIEKQIYRAKRQARAVGGK